jgi:hypothetical protein
MSKKAQKQRIKEYRKPPIPPSRKSDSKAEFERKQRRIDKQNLKKATY